MAAPFHVILLASLDDAPFASKTEAYEVYCTKIKKEYLSIKAKNVINKIYKLSPIATTDTTNCNNEMNKNVYFNN